MSNQAHQFGKIRSLALVALVTFTTSTKAADVRLAQVATEQGVVQGVIEGEAVTFKGVPFAKPPVDSLRWKPPQPAPEHEGILIADHFKPMCMTTIPAIPGGPMESVSEDCLYLNIWAPVKRSPAKLPVMVWIYGGGMRGGSASSPTYWGDQLIKRGVISVNLSYRVGSLGFLAHPELTQESDHRVSGNYGILDMVAALQWVQRNIEAFGGDPRNVTVFGQSAGAFGVGYLMISPLARGLVHRAIGQSSADMGPAGTVAGMMLPKDAEASGVRFAEALGAKTLTEMRRISATRIVSVDSSRWPINANGELKTGSTATLDGYVFPMDMYDTYAAGKQNDVPLLVGYNANEGGDILWEPAKALAYKASINAQYGELAPKVLDLYPATSDEIAARSQLSLLRDNWFGWHMWTWAKLQAANGHHKVFFYNFSHVQEVPADSDLAGIGAAHGFELPYVFGHSDQLPIKASQADNRILESVSTYWTNFAKTGTPNGNGLPTWPNFTGGNPRVLQIANPIHAVSGIDRKGLELQDLYMKRLRASQNLSRN